MHRNRIIEIANLVEKSDVSSSRLQQSHQHAQERAFAGPVRSQQTGDLPRIEVQIESSNRLHSRSTPLFRGEDPPQLANRESRNFIWWNRLEICAHVVHYQLFFSQSFQQVRVPELLYFRDGTKIAIRLCNRNK